MAENRTERITIKVTPTMYKRLSFLAEEIGQAPATLASVYLGETIRAKELQRETNKAVIDRMGEAMQESLEPMMKAFEQLALEDQLNTQRND